MYPCALVTRQERLGFENERCGCSEQQDMLRRIVHGPVAQQPRLDNSLCRLPRFTERPPLIAVGFRELGAEQEDLGGVIDPYQNDDERARGAVG